MDVVFMVGCKKGSMECVMDFSCFEKMELVCNKGENFHDSEGFFSFGGEFGVGYCMEHFRLWASSQTLSPLAKGENPQLLHKDMT